MDYKKIDFSHIDLNLNYRYNFRTQWSDLLEQGILLTFSNNKELRVRWMQMEDVSEVQRIEWDVFPSPWPLESLIFRLHERDYNISIVGLVDNKIVSYAISYVVYDELHFSNLAVTEKYRRLQFGKALLWMSLQVGAEKKCELVHLEVKKNNTPAIQLYKEFGFEIFGIREKYYSKENQDALLMCKKINLESSYGLV